jgi:hypothetical protein
MKKIGFVVGSAFAFSCLASSAFAMNTYRASDYKCADLKALVQNEGVVELTGMFNSRDTYYADGSLCPSAPVMSDTIVVPQGAYIGASDTSFCFVGYVCTEQNLGGGN